MASATTHPRRHRSQRRREIYLLLVYLNIISVIQLT
jgi:hypothetical protein